MESLSRQGKQSGRGRGVSRRWKVVKGEQKHILLFTTGSRMKGNFTLLSVLSLHSLTPTCSLGAERLLLYVKKLSRLRGHCNSMESCYYLSEKGNFHCHERVVMPTVQATVVNWERMEHDFLHEKVRNLASWIIQNMCQPGAAKMKPIITCHDDGTRPKCRTSVRRGMSNKKKNKRAFLMSQQKWHNLWMWVCVSLTERKREVLKVMLSWTSSASLLLCSRVIHTPLTKLHPPTAQREGKKLPEC